MVHSFSHTENKNGNLTVQFFENNKKRHIIFTKGTEALDLFDTALKFELGLSMSRNIPWLDDSEYMDLISFIKGEGYYFKANPNNSSIFRPVSKSLVTN